MNKATCWAGSWTAVANGAIALGFAVGFGCTTSTGSPGAGGADATSSGGSVSDGSAGANVATPSGAGVAAAGVAGGGAGSGGVSSELGGSAGLGGLAGGGGLAGTAGNGGVSSAGGAEIAGTGGNDSTNGGGGAGGSSSSCLPASPLTGGTQYCANSKGDAGPGYGYERWAGGEGSGCMTVYGVDAKFSASWTESNDFLARAGLRFDRSKTHAQIGTLSAEFAETWTEAPVQGKTSKIYLAVYGWTLEPLAEYYIIEDYGSFVPGPAASDGSPRTHVGTITVDDGTYDIWSLAVKGKPAITGDNKDFNQYFSVRQVRRQCGHISISEHFSRWGNLGLPLGKMEETMFLMEAQNNSGTVNVSTATISVK